MILAFLSFGDYFLPKYFLLENVRNFVSFNKGYQVRFGIPEAGAFGVSQSRKRAFISVVCLDDILPERIENGAPLRGITVKDTISDLLVVVNRASKGNMKYQNDHVSWFQKKFRAEMVVLTDLISKERIKLNLIRFQKIPKRPGSD
ncbi:hypothetical protein DEO72_LG5g1874 [Vigna unguiculata]|uniref:DNA (cytosine-5-)-methyltransferase n=1 Tax=Vigna unguiculata TaxID=3917 RepID=A0A4D6LZM4_VIGUN|nr:hypothetical protein DEO72_LG5g1874 [Vigna unguiculata]